VVPRSSGPRASRDVARDALARLRGRRIGALGDGPAGFTPSAFDPDQLAQLLGLAVVPRSIDAMIDTIRQVPVHLRERERAAATEWQPSISVLDCAEVDRFAATTVALRQWRDEDRLDALAVRCWPELPDELGACPCSALARLADEHVPTQCERDVHGAATMLLLDALGAGPTYLVDTVDVVPEDGVVRFWHCGAAATRLAADPEDATQWVHANRRIGVAGNFALRPGRVVAARLSDDPDRPGALRLLLAAGTVLAAPNRFQGNTADVRLDTDPTELATALVTGGFPHHTVLAWADVRPALRAVADELDIAVLEFG
jgi:L-fucose isomerase-like protein